MNATLSDWFPPAELPEILAAIEKARPFGWTHETRLKYLKINIDTRDGMFSLHDRDGLAVTPDQVIAWANLGDGRP